MMEGNELEEGEAFGDCVDPDVDLSYIDEKLQDVLGHFQKDFEGGVSAENLGAKFGGYGSFLPSYQRSPPILSQSPPVPLNHTISKSPYSSSVENPSVPRCTSVSKDDTALIAQPVKPGRKDNFISSLSSWGRIPNLDSNNKLVNGSDQKSLKVRIKVGPDNTLSRNNAAIYSGLGLDTPPSSLEDSPGVSPWLSTAFQSTPGESPLSILQAMTCFSVPGGYLISPLHGYLCQLTENGNLSSRKINSTIPTWEMNLNCKGDGVKMLENETDIDNVDRIDSRVLNMSIQSCTRGSDPKAERQMVDDSGKDFTKAFGNTKVLSNSSEKDRFQLPNSAKIMKSSGSHKSGNDTTQFKDKRNSITSLVENNIGGRNPTNHKDISSDALSEGKGKNQKSYDATTSNVYEYEGRNDHVTRHAKSTKQMPFENNAHEKIAEEMVQGNNKAYDGKRREKTSNNNCTLSVGSIQSQENMRPSSSLVVSKEKKKSFHTKGQPKAEKSRKEFKKDHSGESQRDQRPEKFEFTERSMERMRVKKDVSIHPETMANPQAINSNVAVTLNAPPVVVIKDNWVCCDECQKWRLLPHGQNPNNLPKKWKCSMQDWLPGLNRCNIPEEETTKAFNALFLVPTTENGAKLNGHHDFTASRITVGEHQHADRIYTSEKKRSELTVTSNLPKSLISEKNTRAAVKSKSSLDMDEYASETNSSKACIVSTSKSTYIITNEDNDKEEKRKILGHNADEGYFTGKIIKPSKSKNKREVNQDGLKPSKKSKKENFDFADTTPQSMGNDLSDVQKSGSLEYAAKKRKVKDWQDSQVHQETIIRSQYTSESNLNGKENLSEGKPRKQMKCKLSQFDGKESNISNADCNRDIKGPSTQYLLSANDLKRDFTSAHLPTAATSSSSKVSRSSRSQSKSRSNLHEAKASPVESVSSSPLRTCPVEKISVKRSSELIGGLNNVDHSFMASPKRLLNGELGSDQLKYVNNHIGPVEIEDINVVSDSDNILNSDDRYVFKGLEKGLMEDFQDNHDNHHFSNGTSQQKSDKSSSGFKERSRSSSSDASRGKIKASNPLNKKGLYTTKPENNDNENSNKNIKSRDENGSLPDTDAEFLEKKSFTKRSHFDRRDNHYNNGLEEILVAGKMSFNPQLQESNQQAHSYRSDNPIKREVLQADQPPKDNSEEQNTGPQTVTPIKRSSSDANPIDATNFNAVKVSKQSRHPNNLRQATPNIQDSSPMRKDGPSIANVVIKEARDIKHSANRFKNEGLTHESTGLYFEAALKFLHGASLLEPPHGETNPSMQMIQMYSETANFFEYCALEYERCKEMAAAALAYKCAEVAYMKVAYYKHPGANKDRHELQTALQTTIPGESPSSSASDIDNLNNQSTLDKAVVTKNSASPKIAGNHVIAARNRPNFTRLLNYTNGLNYAFDATKKSQNAIAAASASVEKDKVDAISSVRKVLNFNFHNIEGLLRLVRLSMELISP